jgi:hypothetical protein
VSKEDLLSHNRSRSTPRTTNLQRTATIPGNPLYDHHGHLVHVEAMARLKASFTKSELHIPRMLDQSYHEALSAEDLKLRNEDQVLYRYLARLEQEIARQHLHQLNSTAPSRKTPTVSAEHSNTNSHSSSGQSQIKGPFERRTNRANSTQSSKKSDGTKAVGLSGGKLSDKLLVVPADAESQQRSSRDKRHVISELRKQVLVVSQLWVWRIDESIHTRFYIPNTRHLQLC